MMWGKCAYEVADFDRITDPRGWDGYVRLFHKKLRTFPIGLLPIVRGVLNDHNIEHVVRHTPTNQVSIELPEISDAFVTRPYQDDCVNDSIEQRIGVIRMATGGGKTVVAGHIISRLGLPSLFLVHTKDLLYQAIGEFGKMFDPVRVGQIGDGKIDIREITVATIQTMSRVYDFEYQRFDEDDIWDDEKTIIARSEKYIQDAMDGVGVVFMDECHRVAAPTAMKVMECLRNPRFRLGLSASPWRDDGADLAIQACLGTVAYSITASDLIEMGYLVPPIIRMVDVPARSFPRKAKYDTIYKEYIVENDERNQRVVSAAASMVRRGRPTLVLVQRIRHGTALQELISDRIGTWVPFISGRDSAGVRKKAIDDIREGRSGILIASVIADEGLDIKPLSGLILAGGGKSSVKALQRIGRTLRIFNGKEDAEIVDFNDQAKYLAHHSNARERLYETESAWTIIDA